MHLVGWGGAGQMSETCLKDELLPEEIEATVIGGRNATKAPHEKTQRENK